MPWTPTANCICISLGNIPRSELIYSPLGEILSLECLKFSLNLSIRRYVASFLISNWDCDLNFSSWVLRVLEIIEIEHEKYRNWNCNLQDHQSFVESAPSHHHHSEKSMTSSSKTKRSAIKISSSIFLHRVVAAAQAAPAADTAQVANADTDAVVAFFRKFRNPSQHQHRFPKCQKSFTSLSF